jgi:hypothetical protein
MPTCRHSGAFYESIKFNFVLSSFFRGFVIVFNSFAVRLGSRRRLMAKIALLYDACRKIRG